MRQKGIQIILISMCMLFALVACATSVGGKINTDSQLAVVNTGIEGFRPVVDGNIIVFTHDVKAISLFEVYYHDINTRSTVSTGIEGWHLGVDIPYIVILSPEWWIGDLNGDGDTGDHIESYYNIDTGKNTVFAENANIHYACIENEKIVYDLREDDDKTDYNGDGDTDDVCGFYYDIQTGVSTYFADARNPRIYGNYIIWEMQENLYCFDLATNTSFEIGFNTLYPKAEIWEYKIDGDIIGFTVHEGGSPGEDINGDGDTSDFFSAYYDIVEGKLKIITDVESRFADISQGKIVMELGGAPKACSLYDIETESVIELQDCFGDSSNIEADIIVSQNWSLEIPEEPPPIYIPSVQIYNITTQEMKNTHITGYLSDFDGEVITMVTWEGDILEDLNGDGDTWDFIVRYIIEATPVKSTIDIDPDTLNLKSKGRWITCYIELPEGFDVNDINVSTISLEDSIPAEEWPWEIGDYDGDGIPDLMVKFDRAEVEDMLSPGNYNLKVSGQFSDGTLFEGYSDTIRAIDPP